LGQEVAGTSRIMIACTATEEEWAQRLVTN